MKFCADYGIRMSGNFYWEKCAIDFCVEKLIFLGIVDNL